MCRGVVTATCRSCSFSARSRSCRRSFFLLIAGIGSVGSQFLRPAQRPADKLPAEPVSFIGLLGRLVYRAPSSRKLRDVARRDVAHKGDLRGRWTSSPSFRLASSLGILPG